MTDSENIYVPLIDAAAKFLIVITFVLFVFLKYLIYRLKKKGFNFEFNSKTNSEEVTKNMEV